MELYSNNPGSTLASGIDGSVGTLTVISAAGYPPSGNFRIRIDNELMLVTGVTGAVFTVTRAIEGTSGVSHLYGAMVNHYLTAASIDQIRVENCQSGTVAARPLPANARTAALYFPTNGTAIQRNTGSAWLSMGPVLSINPIEDLSGYAYYPSQGSCIAATSGGLFTMRDQINGAKFYGKTAPTPPFTWTATLNVGIATSTNDTFLGVGYYDSTTTKVSFVGMRGQGNVICYHFDRMNGGASSYTGVYDPSSGLATNHTAGKFYVGFQDNGTSVIPLFSADGVNYLPFGNTSWLRAAFTANYDKIGFFCACNNVPYILSCWSISIS